MKLSFKLPIVAVVVATATATFFCACTNTNASDAVQPIVQSSTSSSTPAPEPTPAPLSEDDGLTVPTMAQLKDSHILDSLTDEADMEALSPDDLMLLILELSDRMDRGEADPESFMVVLKVTVEKIIPIIEDEDFIAIVGNKEYPESFRFFFTEMYGYSYPIVEKLNTDVYNNTLKAVSEDTTESDYMRVNAVTAMNDNSDRAELLVMMYSQVGDEQKSVVLKQLSFANPEKANLLAKEILKDYKKHELELVGLADNVLVRTQQGAEDIALILAINKELIESGDEWYRKTAVFALSEMSHNFEAAALIAQAEENSSGK